MSAIGKGDWVECVAPSLGQNRPAKSSCRLAKGRVYRVRGLLLGRALDTGTDTYGLLLDGVHAYHENGAEGAWHPSMFSPIYRPPEHAFDYLLENLPADLDERETERARSVRAEVHPVFRAEPQNHSGTVK